MSLTIRDTKTTPKPDKWRFPDVNGVDIVENSYMNLKREVRMHYAANGKEPPGEQEIINYLCANVAVPCFDGPNPVRNRFTDPPSMIERGKPSPAWPLMLSPLKLLAKEGDRGLGDIVARVVGPIGGDAFKRWHFKIFGKPCSCGDRQDFLNADFPL